MGAGEAKVVKNKREAGCTTTTPNPPPSEPKNPPPPPKKKATWKRRRWELGSDNNCDHPASSFSSSSGKDSPPHKKAECGLDHKRTCGSRAHKNDKCR